MFRLILPKTRPHLDETFFYHLPLFFLAGPIAGGGDWQMVMTNKIVQKVGDCIVANPCRYRPEHPHYQYLLKGNRDNDFPTQTFWERYYLRQAALEWRQGCIVFWLPCESSTEPRTDGNPYAMDSRGEIAEWRTHLMYNSKVRLVVGAEPDFPGLRTIRRNFADAIGPDFRICETLEEVVERAVRYA